jgi:hypothetical protein
MCGNADCTFRRLICGRMLVDSNRHGRPQSQQKAQQHNLLAKRHLPYMKVAVAQIYTEIEARATWGVFKKATPVFYGSNEDSNPSGHAK